jgi:hypothetical protein
MIHGGIYFLDLIFGNKVLLLFCHSDQTTHQGDIEHLELDLFDICYGFA